MNIKEAKQMIATSDVCGHVCLVKGLHGIGKSESAAQYAHENNMHYEPLILSLMDTGDLLGMPITREVGGVTSTVWAAPSWYTNIVNNAWPEHMQVDDLNFIDPQFKKHLMTHNHSSTISRDTLNTMYCEFYHKPNDKLQLLRQENVQYSKSRRSLLLLDEFNRAPQDILNASLQLILDHRLHSHELPIVDDKETLIVAAINPADGDYTVNEFDPALLDRFVDCDVELDYKSWRTWAKSNKVNDIVIDFLNENQKKFHFTPEDGSKGASPRSWTRLSNYINNLDNTPKDVFTHYIKGTVGSSLAAQFISFYNNYGTALDYGKLKELVVDTITQHPDENVEVISSYIENTVSDIDAVKRLEFADAFMQEFINEATAEEAMPLLVYLYALPLESLSAALKSTQTNHIEDYANLAILDNEANQKGLFKKLVTQISN